METYTLTKKELIDLMDTVSRKASIETIEMLGAPVTSTVSMRKASEIFGRRKIETLIRERKIKTKLVGNATMVNLSDVLNHLKPTKK